MSNVVNLRMVRKARARVESAATAAENRARHGRTKAERVAATHIADRLARATDGARLDPSPECRPDSAAD